MNPLSLAIVCFFAAATLMDGVSGIGGIGLIGVAEKEFKCPADAKGKYPCASDCGNFVNCPGDKKETCPDGKKFDSYKRDCVDAASADCGACKKTPALDKAYTDGNYIDTSSKKHYFVCKDGIPARWECNKDEFDPKEASCAGGKGKKNEEVAKAMPDTPEEKDKYRENALKDEAPEQRSSCRYFCCRFICFAPGNKA